MASGLCSTLWGYQRVCLGGTMPRCAVGGHPYAPLGRQRYPGSLTILRACPERQLLGQSSSLCRFCDAIALLVDLGCKLGRVARPNDLPSSSHSLRELRIAGDLNEIR